MISESGLSLPDPVLRLQRAAHRTLRLPLTEKGQAAAARMLAALADLERDAFSRLSAEHIAGCHAVISVLQEAS